MLGLQIFQNMAHCYQKTSRLEECSICLETCLEQLMPVTKSLKDRSVANRLYMIKMECKNKM